MSDKNRRSMDSRDNRPDCKYGSNCYQRQPDHHKRFRHPESSNNSSNRQRLNRGRRDIRERRDDTKINENKDSGETKDHESKEIKDTKESKEIKDTKESKEIKDNKEGEEIKDTKESKEIQDTKESKEIKDNKESEEIPEEINEIKETEKNKDNNEVKKSDDSEEINESKDCKKDHENMDNKDNKIDEETEDSKEIQESNQNINVKETGANTNNKRKSPEEDGSSSSIETPKAKKQNTSPGSNIVKAKEATNETDVDPYKEAKELIKKAFLFSLPDDFFKFWEFCKELKPSDPTTAFKILDLKLVGPYDVLAGLITEETLRQKELLTHWRYFYDPPEFQTILKGSDKDGLHFGYWRDRPSSLPVFVASNSCNVSHKIKPIGENPFAAVKCCIEDKANRASPFEKPGLFNLLAKIRIFTKKYDINIDDQTPKMKAREKLVVARTIHGAGIVVPYNKKTQVGYRELSVTDNQLLKIIKRIDDPRVDNERSDALSELQEIVRLATIAGDECDFGTCLELGHDLLSTGSEHVIKAALVVFSIAYNQLDRQPFLRIIEAHMKNRKKGSNTSALPSGGKDHFSLS